MPPDPDLILKMDPPRHTQIRRLITNKFTPRYVERFRQDIQRATDELLDAIAPTEQPLDLVEQFAVPLTSRSVCASLGMPTEDVELAGITVRAGELVIPVTSRANRDPSVFPAPDRLDVTREECPHLSFGPGRHHCVGAQLARMELQVGIGSLIRRFPTLRLAVPDSELQWRTGEQFHELVSLPVQW